MNCLFGIETEYGVAALSDTPSPGRNDAVADGLVADIRTHEPTLDAAGGGIFVANGSRVYVDASHLEVSTPEVTDPWDLVRYALAGDRLLERAALRRFGRRRRSRPLLFKTNVDYGARATWACHESVLVSGRPDLVAMRLIPHLASRVIYTGAGGLDPFSSGITFTMSPRAHFIRTDEVRPPRLLIGFAYGKNDPLTSGPYDRVHLTCGESLCSERAMWLRSATTVLVTALIDHDISFGAEVDLADPVAAIHAFAADAEMRADAELLRGGRATAIDLQRRYLALAEARVDAPFMPPWARTACAEWRTVLDQCERDRQVLCASLDWGIKRTLFERVLRRHGLDWGTAAALTDAAGQFWRAAGEWVDPALAPVSARLSDPLVLAHARECGAVEALAESGVTWEAFRRFHAARDALRECDIRFGELGGRGIFDELDSAGVLTHRVEGVRPIEPALNTPPASSRAKVRGDAVRRLSDRKARYSCDWARIGNLESDIWLDLNNPFESEARWHPAEAQKEAVREATVRS